MIIMVRDVGEDDRSLNRRIDLFRRERDSVRRLLEQASLDGVRKNVERLNNRFDRLDSELSGENDSS